MLAPSSPILPTLVTPPYQAHALWKDLWVVAILGTSTVFLWKALEEDQATSGVVEQLTGELDFRVP